MMRARPVRSQIYLPVTVFGVVSSDWKYVLVAGLLGYTVPYLFDLRLWNIPMELVTSVVGMAITIAILNLIRVGKRPYWLQHHVKALLEHSHHRRRLPSDLSGCYRPWMKNGEDLWRPESSWRGQPQPPAWE
jgi:hypothetical protein